MNEVSAMRPGLAKIIEKVCTSGYFESHETDFHIAEYACGIDHADTWSSKRVHWLWKNQSPHRGTFNYGCEDPLELNTGVARARLLITGIDMQVASKSTIDSLPATFHNSRWMDHCEVCHGSVEAIPILDSVYVKEAYSHFASRDHSIQWHVRSHAWRDASFSREEDSMKGRHGLRREVCSTNAVQILRWIDYIRGHASDSCTYPPFFPEAPNI